MNASNVHDEDVTVAVRGKSSRWLRRGVAATAGVMIITIANMGVAEPAHAEDPSWHEVVNCVGDPAGCFAANDAAHWALGTASWLYGVDSLHNGAGDAFRHCIWSGALTQRIGPERAYDITTAHEHGSDSPLSEVSMDLGNNAIGRAIGSRANAEGGSDTWGWIISQCQGLERNNWLYRLGYDPSSYA